MLFTSINIICQCLFFIKLNKGKSKTLFRKINKTKTAVVKAGPSDTEYLYYPLDMENVTLKGSLLPALR